MSEILASIRKPRLYRNGGAWVCSYVDGRYSPVGVGVTPADAYQDWGDEVYEMTMDPAIYAREPR